MTPICSLPEQLLNSIVAFEQLIGEILRDENQPVSQLDLLLKDEKRLLGSTFATEEPEESFLL